LSGAAFGWALEEGKMGRWEGEAGLEDAAGLFVII
jgi:hypothetical protein